VVKMGSLEEQWITEAFAEYSSSLVIKKLKGDGAYDSMVSTWRANANDATKMSPIPLAQPAQHSRRSTHELPRPYIPDL